jgi:hypothetical protein
MKTYDPRLTLGEAVREYFTHNKFGDDGGYGAKWVPIKLGPLTFFVPNTKERVRAVRFHDLHHVLTGYETDLAGEFEISGWELASGCADMTVAWYLNLQGLIAGFLVHPRRTVAAFARGRKSRNLYREVYGPEILNVTVGEMTKRVGLEPPPEPTMSLYDWLLLGGYTALGVPTGVIGLVTSLALIPVALTQIALASPTSSPAAKT